MIRMGCLCAPGGLGTDVGLYHRTTIAKPQLSLESLPTFANSQLASGCGFAHRDAGSKGATCASLPTLQSSANHPGANSVHRLITIMQSLSYRQRENIVSIPFFLFLVFHIYCFQEGVKVKRKANLVKFWASCHI